MTPAKKLCAFAPLREKKHAWSATHSGSDRFFFASKQNQPLKISALRPCDSAIRRAQGLELVSHPERSRRVETARDENASC